MAHPRPLTYREYAETTAQLQQALTSACWAGSSDQYGCLWLIRVWLLPGARLAHPNVTAGTVKQRSGKQASHKTAHNNSHSTANCSLEVVLGCASLAPRGEMSVKDISLLRPLAPSMLAAGQTEDGFCQAFLLAERADEFAKAVPDQAQWVTRFAKHFGVVHMHEVMTQVGYDGPGELFSMYLCIFLARSLVERHTPLLTACAQVPGAVSRSRPRCLGVVSWQA